jgi:hypothetical protein
MELNKEVYGDMLHIHYKDKVLHEIFLHVTMTEIHDLICEKEILPDFENERNVIHDIVLQASYDLKIGLEDEDLECVMVSVAKGYLIQI